MDKCVPKLNVLSIFYNPPDINPSIHQHTPPWIRADLLPGNLLVSRLTMEALHLVLELNYDSVLVLKQKNNRCPFADFPPNRLPCRKKYMTPEEKKRKIYQINKRQKPSHLDPATNFIYFSYHLKRTPSNPSFTAWDAETQGFPLICLHMATTGTSYSSSCRVRPMTVTLASWALNFPELWVTGKQIRKVLIETGTRGRAHVHRERKKKHLVLAKTAVEDKQMQSEMQWLCREGLQAHNADLSLWRGWEPQEFWNKGKWQESSFPWCVCLVRHINISCSLEDLCVTLGGCLWKCI